MEYLQERKEVLKQRAATALDHTSTVLSIATGGHPPGFLGSDGEAYEKRVSEYRMTDPEAFQDFYDECREIIEREDLAKSLDSFGVREGDRVLENEDIDRLLTNADLADNPEDVYHWVCDHYHAQPHIGFHDVIRLNELENYAERMGYTEVEDQARIILDTKDPLKNISRPSAAEMKENIGNRARSLKKRWRNEIESLTDTENGYQGWRQPPR